MINKEIVVDILKETEKIQDNEEFYDDSEEFLSKLNEDTVVFLSSPISETLEKTSLLLGDLYKGKYSLSLPKGSEYFTVGSNIVFRLARKKAKESEPEPNPVVVTPESIEEGKYTQDILAGGTPSTSQLDKAMRKLQEVGMGYNVDPNHSTEFVSYTPEYQEKAGAKSLVLKPAEPLFTDMLMMPVPKYITKLARHAPEATPLHTDEHLASIYGSSDLHKALKRTLTSSEAPIVSRIYVPKHKGGPVGSYVKFSPAAYVEYDEKGRPKVKEKGSIAPADLFDAEDSKDVLAYTLGFIHNLRNKASNRTDPPEDTPAPQLQKIQERHKQDILDHIKATLPSIRKLMAERSAHTPEEIDTYLQSLATPEFVSRVLDKANKIKPHIEIPDKLVTKYTKNPKVYNDITSLENQYYRGSTKNNHTVIRSNSVGANASDHSDEDSNRHTLALKYLLRPIEVHGIQKKGYQHLSDEVEYKMHITHSLTSSLLKKVSETPAGEDRQKLLDKLQQVKENHDHLLAVYMFLHLGARPGTTQSKNKKAKSESTETDDEDSLGLATLANENVQADGPTPAITFVGKKGLANTIPLVGKVRSWAAKQLELNKKFNEVSGHSQANNNFLHITPGSDILKVLKDNPEIPFNLSSVAKNIGLLDAKGNPILVPYTFRKFNVIRKLTSLTQALGVLDARKRLLKRLGSNNPLEDETTARLPQDEFNKHVESRGVPIDKVLEHIAHANKEARQAFNPQKAGLNTYANLILQHGIDSPSHMHYIPIQILRTAYHLGTKHHASNLRKYLKRPTGENK